MFGLPLPRLGRPSRFSNASFTGQIKAADGTALLPAYTFASDATSGAYISAGSYAFATGGILRGYFSATGNFVLATSSLWLDATGASTLTPGTNSIRFGGASTLATSRLEINKAVTGFTDAVAKTVFTVTVPNAAHHAVLEIEVQGALGAGGAIGAGEAMATNTYKIAIVRTAGVATVATATAATHAVAVAVAGAATVTATAAVSAMSGAVGATQTFTIDVTITKSGGASGNHTCLAYAKLVNANATGISIV